MKKILFLLLLTVSSYGQTLQNPTYGNTTTNTLKIKTPATVSTVSFLSTNEADGSVSKIAPINVNIPYTPGNYSAPTQTIGNHLLGIDTRLGQISSTSAGLTQRIYFTADNTTVNAVTYFASNATSKGTTATGSPPALVLGDNTKGYFTKDVISIAQPSPTIGYAGTYSGNLTVSATPTPVATQQRFTLEVYRTNNLGAPIASGVSGAPVGDLGVTVVAILDSGVINLSAGAITNVSITGILTQNITINTGERLRYHVSAAKIGTGGGNVTFGVYYGTSYNSYYDVPVSITTDAVLNKSTVTGVTSSDALNTLNTLKLKNPNWKSPQDYGAVGDGVTDDTAAIQNCFNVNKNILLYGSYKISGVVNLSSDMFVFSNNATISKSTSNTDILYGENKTNIWIDGALTLVGSGNTIGTANGIHLKGCDNTKINGVVYRNILGNGLLIENGLGTAPRGDGILVSNNQAINCYAGIRLNAEGQGEYNSVNNFNATLCGDGAIILAGNVTFTGGNFVDNIKGIYIGGVLETNNSHGILNGVNVNHNDLNLQIENAQYGQTINGCHFYGTSTHNIEIINSVGISFNSCHIDGKLFNLDDQPVKGAITVSHSYLGASFVEDSNGTIYYYDNFSLTNGNLGSSSVILPSQTANTIASFDTNKSIKSLSTTTYPNLIELSYLKGATSSVQTQLNGKQSTLTNPITGTGTSGFLPIFTGTTTIGNASNLNLVSSTFSQFSVKGTGTGDAGGGSIQFRNQNTLFGEIAAETESAGNGSMFFRTLTGGTSTQKVSISSNGVFKINNLGGSGDANVVTDLNGNLKRGDAVVSGVKRYKALTSQTGTSTPIVTVLENSIGSIVWTRTGTGQYTGTLACVFTSNKVYGNFQYRTFSSPNIQTSAVQSSNINTIDVFSLSNGTVSDSILTGCILIEVYP